MSDRLQLQAMVLLMSACNKKYGHDLLLTVENARMEKVCQYDLDMILEKTLFMQRNFKKTDLQITKSCKSID